MNPVPDCSHFSIFFLTFFLGATKHLYNWLCPLVCLLVCNAFVRRSTRRTLLAYLALFFGQSGCCLKNMITKTTFSCNWVFVCKSNFQANNGRGSGQFSCCFHFFCFHFCFCFYFSTSSYPTHQNKSS